MNNNNERVSIIEGSNPIIVIAPHGYNGDDENTGLIARRIATTIDCYAVINNGWERAENVDIFHDKADCNNTVHCHEDVVKEEFLDPIFKFVNRNVNYNKIIYTFYIHGMANHHRNNISNSKLDIVLGYGAGTNDSFSIEPWRKDLFAWLLHEAGFNVFEGKQGGQFSGWAKSNMNQLFRKWYLTPRVHSLQIEIVKEFREKTTADLTSEYLAAAMESMLSAGAFIKPQGFNIKQY
jgi:hypothetical protein